MKQSVLVLVVFIITMNSTYIALKLYSTYNLFISEYWCWLVILGKISVLLEETTVIKVYLIILIIFIRCLIWGDIRLIIFTVMVVEKELANCVLFTSNDLTWAEFNDSTIIKYYIKKNIWTWGKTKGDSLSFKN